MAWVYLNGEFLPHEEAKISVFDRGFLMGDGIYEVVPVFGDKLFRFKHHIARLRNSLRLISLDIDYSDQQWRNLMLQLVKRNGGGHQGIYLQITRGCDPHLLRKHAFPQPVQPTIFMSSDPIPTNSKEAMLQGATAITLPDTRWERCDIKSIGLLANILATQEAMDKGAKDAILIRDGLALEGASSNLFIVKDNNIITPPIGPYILGGITRELLLELAKQHNIPIEERNIPAQELQQCDEIWFSSSTKELVPVLALDNQPIGNGHVGPMAKRMIDLYIKYREALRES